MSWDQVLCKDLAGADDHNRLFTEFNARLHWRRYMRHTCANGTVIAGLTVIALFSSSALAADQIPNIKGKWVGKTHTIVAGAGAHWPGNKSTFDKPGLFGKELGIEITNQQDNRVWGKQTFSGHGEQNSDEPMIGELTGPGYKNIILVDTDGYLHGQFTDENTLTFCYEQAGGKTTASVVSCSELKRKP